MFKIYLSRRLHETDDDSSRDEGVRSRNRRLFERFDVSDQHILALNDEDILRVKDISAKGFSCEISQRAYDKFVLADVYEAQLRYLGDQYEVVFKVAWKANDDQVGFELLKPSKETKVFFKRLLLPMEIAGSLHKVEASFMDEQNDSKTWYHGDIGTDLILWRDDKGVLEAWQLVTNEQFVEWNAKGGLRTGSTQTREDSEGGLLEPAAELMIPDESPSLSRLRLATDIMMALSSEDSKEILPTLTEKPWDYGSESTKDDDDKK
ncbi:hypothetical protein [Pseudobacteriovorax antillogorgiicola]|uniref:PilZ domain-containing protein n=1 Tax=Pseudobacteriovorax antillogorgiicola TaxID=1513793 RepID=A0A1Y6B7G0_9BACT|nr:hypothetical protein [Pseudobacteriovorax antillogorgiicola]TCS58798.1 hypothetical protein EDD56_102313 [Pseudobacteriovorax antillogorgiicola]SME94568.1 hypothetical protein SAMN06296036_102130 [Pseudobacteriovorax antillogorgiicola]